MSMTAYHTLVSKYTHVFDDRIYERRRDRSTLRRARSTAALPHARSPFSVSLLIGRTM